MSKKIIARKNKNAQRIAASEHIEKLFNIAKNSKEKEVSINSIQLAIDYSKRYRLRIPKDLKRSFCRNCFTIYDFGKNARIRFSPGKKPLRIITCLECGYIRRIGYSKNNHENITDKATKR